MLRKLKLATTRGASIHLIGPDANDPVLSYMVRHGIPQIRQNWLDISYPAGDLPQEWTADLESEVPKVFRVRD
jgi:hypothetical protein